MQTTLDTRHHAHSRTSRWIAIAIAGLVALALPGLARAQTPAELTPPPAFQQETAADEKSPGTALAFALVPTAAGVGMILAAPQAEGDTLLGLGGLMVLVGPSFGHFYAGDSAMGLAQIGVRVGASGALVVGALWTVLESCSWGLFGEPAECDAPPPGAAALMIGGAVVGTASTIYSIYDAPRAARRTNARRSRQLMLTPAPVAGPDGTSGMGLHLTGRF